MTTSRRKGTNPTAMMGRKKQKHSQSRPPGQLTIAQMARINNRTSGSNVGNDRDNRERTEKTSDGTEAAADERSKTKKTKKTEKNGYGSEDNNEEYEDYEFQEDSEKSENSDDDLTGKEDVRGEGKMTPEEKKAFELQKEKEDDQSNDWDETGRLNYENKTSIGIYSSEEENGSQREEEATFGNDQDEDNESTETEIQDNRDMMDRDQCRKRTAEDIGTNDPEEEEEDHDIERILPQHSRTNSQYDKRHEKPEATGRHNKETRTRKPLSGNTTNPYSRSKDKPNKFTKNFATNGGRTVMARFDLKMTVAPADDAIKALTKTFRDVFVQLQSGDKGLSILPYSENDKRLPPITDPEKLPKDLMSFRAYVNGAFPRPKGGKAFCKVLLAFNKSWTTIADNSNWWLQAYEHGLWKRSIQYENVVPIGWLLYSHKDIDSNKLQKEIELRTDLEVGIRYRKVKTGTWSNEKVPDNEIVKALHLEVAEHDQEDAERILGEIYSSDSEEFFRGIRMRLVPEFDTVMNERAREKVRYLAARQLAWINGLDSMKTWEIATMELTTRENGKSIREMIMEIEHPRIPGKQLFHSIDMTYNQKGIVCSFLPQYAAEARTMVSGLLPYLKYRHGEWVSKYFTPNAASRSETALWDDKLKMVISKEDKTLDKLVDADEDLDLMSEEQTKQFEFDKTPDTVNQHGGTAEFLKDSDSISTFRNKARTLKGNRYTALGRSLRSRDNTEGGSSSQSHEDRNSKTESNEQQSRNRKPATQNTERRNSNTSEGSTSTLSTKVTSLTNDFDLVKSRVGGLEQSMQRAIMMLERLLPEAGGREEQPDRQDGPPTDTDRDGVGES